MNACCDACAGVRRWYKSLAYLHAMYLEGENWRDFIKWTTIFAEMSRVWLLSL